MKKLRFFLSVLFLSGALLPLSVSAGTLETISIFGDTTNGKMSKNDKTAYQLGKMLADNKKKIVTGGETSGITGAVLKGAYEAGADITPVAVSESFDAYCPETHFCRKIPYTFVDSEEERQMMRADLGDAIVILPGGWEPLAVFAQLANMQAQHRTYINEDKENLKREVASGKKPITALSAADLATPLKKPIIFLNINHYFDHLRYFIDEMRRQKILSEEETSFIGFAEKPKDVLPLAQKLAK